MLEADIRDYLETHLEALGEDLTLVQKEYYLPNPIGTRGFVDLLARDKHGNYVFIELKRSDAAAREALHEVVKYIEGAKRHLGLKDAEMRAVIASTEWAELLVPFSRFVSDMPIDVKGLRLVVHGDMTVSSDLVSALPIEDGRTLSPWHELNLYEDEKSLKDGIVSYETFCKTHSIVDFFFVILTPPAEMFESTSEKYEFILYFVMRQLSDAECAGIVQTATEGDAEKLEELDLIDAQSRAHNYHMFILDLPPSPERDHFEIGYPAKFKNKLLQDEGWKVIEIRIYGVFLKNKDLSDDTLIQEIGAISGETGQALKRQVVLSNRSQYSSLLKALDTCLRDNPMWLSQINTILKTLHQDFPDADIDIDVYNPCRGVYVLYDFVTKDNGVLYAPSYTIKLNDVAIERVYFGDLVEDEEAVTFQDILSKFYEGSVGNLMLARTWGCYEQNDGQILEDLGLVYRSVRIDVENNDKVFYVLRNQRWRPIDEVFPMQSLRDYCTNNPSLISDIVREIGQRDFGGMVDMSVEIPPPADK